MTKPPIDLYDISTLGPYVGRCVGFKAGTPDGHHLINESSADATVLVVGSRSKDDNVHYPDDDFRWQKNSEGRWVAARKDGSVY